MSKKEYLLKILSIVSIEALPIKEDLKLLIENDQISDDIVDIFIWLFQKAIENTNNEIEKEKLTQSINFLNSIKKEEEIDKIGDAETLKNLETLLSNI